MFKRVHLRLDTPIRPGVSHKDHVVVDDGGRAVEVAFRRVAKPDAPQLFAGVRVERQKVGVGRTAVELPFVERDAAVGRQR